MLKSQEKSFSKQLPPHEAANKIKNKHYSPFYEFCNEVRDIASPLLDQGFSFFCFNRYYWTKNIKYISLSTSNTWVKTYDEKKLYRNHDDFPGVYKPGSFFLDDFDIKPSSPQSLYYTMEEFKQIFGDVQLAWILKHNLGSTDAFIFALPKDSKNIKLFFEMNKKFIKRFIKYFKCEANKLITRANKKNVHITDFVELDYMNKRPKSYPHCKSINDNVELKHRRVYLDTPYEGVYLTQQEAKCLTLLCEGKNYHDISEKLDIAYITVRGYIDNIKMKLNCNCKKKLISSSQENNVMHMINDELDNYIDTNPIKLPATLLELIFDKHR